MLTRFDGRIDTRRSMIAPTEVILSLREGEKGWKAGPSGFESRRSVRVHVKVGSCASIVVEVLRQRNGFEAAATGQSGRE